MLQFSRFSIVAIIAVCVFGVLAAVPNLLTKEQLQSLPGFLPKSQVTLGLDLQGGAHLLLEVDTDTVIEERLEGLAEDVRESLREARIRARRPVLDRDARAVTTTLANAEDAAAAREALEALAQPVASSVFGGGIQAVAVSVDGTRVRAALTKEGIDARARSAVAQSIEVVRRRIDELGTREPNIQRVGEQRILLQVPGVGETESLKEVLNAEARLSFHMVAGNAEPSNPPAGTMVLSFADQTRQIVVERRPLLTGENLVDAQPSFDQNGLPVVSIRFDLAGGRTFAEVTRQNVGKPFAIVLDDEVLSAPVIREPILGGQAQISGSFTIEETQDLSVLLRAGALPAPLRILEERTVGPGLGQDSIEAGKLAAVIGLAGVVVFIVASYGLFGVLANAALLLNIVLILGALSAIGATLTLPGIAGIVLTIGMAVDANVLVFERVREEVKAGRQPFQAVDNGYRQALSTILDANITTLIAAVLLFQFGSGPVRGFAVTLGVGIVTSVFTAVVLTRLLLATWLRRTRPAKLPL
ncbi:preprotein translocase subunit SecD [Rhodothalassium salexigens DSM 2132]|uniref:Protein translocase subunit SecD n=1 Tax=Rhodothalassium salexigens DSM 2132 TaxID=1188247 RepID=A0A4R2PRW6_RHOSA|nr:protein translocase subunit SecD [Rhodothalassium salexigens]MBB4210333.1 protein-export membrane protein SecD [Rhodothalassium salexigens DSM 2132]MBK1638875.1 protein translocase subunit SecD [Rhodothalassium salexigens DSM 2132]TCP38497.1 preprotein translocase subunit SecD [Rhodothalassium salexigens DSM 2132]